MSILSEKESGEKHKPSIEEIKNTGKIEEFIQFVDDLETPELLKKLR